jgi:DNA polymerase-3 subunit delta
MATMKDLDKAIETGKFEPVYVLYGPEGGLITEYVIEMKGKFKTIVEENDLDKVIEDSKYNSIFGGRKLYILKHTELFTKKADDKFIAFLVKMFKQRNNVCLFVEDGIDNTLKQTQALSDAMKVEFQHLKEDQLIILVQKILEQNNKKIVKDLARYFVDQCDYNYSTIINELEKLVNFVTEKNITVDHIRAITSRSTNAVIFDLVTYIVKQNYTRALDMYETLILRKESPLVLLTLIYRQLKLLYQIKLLKAEGYKVPDIADACDSKPFIIEKNMNICNFETEKLLKLMVKCDDLDYKIKSGQLKDTLAVKILILYSSIRR